MKNSKKLMACLLSMAMLPAVVTKWQSRAEQRYYGNAKRYKFG